MAKDLVIIREVKMILLNSLSAIPIGFVTFQKLDFLILVPVANYVGAVQYIYESVLNSLRRHKDRR